jgi:hypothetical protein
MAAAAGPVHAHRMHLVGIGHGTVARGEIANTVDRGHVAVHGVERLEHNELGTIRIGRPQQLLELLYVVVTEDPFLAAGLSHALDHGIVVQLVRQDQAIRQQLGNGGNSCLV